MVQLAWDPGGRVGRLLQLRTLCMLWKIYFIFCCCSGSHNIRECWARWPSVNSPWGRRWWYMTWIFGKWKITKKSTQTSVGNVLVLFLHNNGRINFYTTYIYVNHVFFQTTEQNITSAHEKIAECKKEIQKAKRIRKNRQGNFFLSFYTYEIYIVCTCSKICLLKYFKKFIF